MLILSSTTYLVKDSMTHKGYHENPGCCSTLIENPLHRVTILVTKYILLLMPKMDRSICKTITYYEACVLRKLLDEQRFWFTQPVSEVESPKYFNYSLVTVPVITVACTS